MSTISSHQSKFNISSFKSVWFEIQNIINQTSFKYWNFLTEPVLHNFTKHFSGTQVNQLENRYLNGSLSRLCYLFFLYLKNFFCFSDVWKTFTQWINRMMLEIVDKIVSKIPALANNSVDMCMF